MGCDIHAYLEMLTESTFGDKPEIEIDCVADLDIGRNYSLFALLANVRNDGSLVPVCQPKGIPAKVSLTVHRNYYDMVKRDDPKALAQAEEWVAKDWADWEPGDPEHLFISSPDWHNASWLTVEELKTVQVRFSSIIYYRNDGSFTQELYGPHPVLAGIIAMMETLNQTGATTRLVFWFDN